MRRAKESEAGEGRNPKTPSWGHRLKERAGTGVSVLVVPCILRISDRKHSGVGGWTPNKLKRNFAYDILFCRTNVFADGLHPSRASFASVFGKHVPARAAVCWVQPPPRQLHLRGCIMHANVLTRFYRRISAALVCRNFRHFSGVLGRAVFRG